MSLSYSTSTSEPCTISRAYRLSRPIMVPSSRAEVRSRVAPRGVVSLPVPLEVEPRHGVLELVHFQQLPHHVPADQQGIHLIGVELPPEVHQFVIGQLAGGAPDGGGTNSKDLRGILVAVPVQQHADGVLQVHSVDVGADLPQGDGEQVQLLITDGLVGGHQHPSTLVELHQVLLGDHLGLGNGRPPPPTRRRAFWSSPGMEVIER